jgi:4-hydroxyacetophenone monooxygenase
MSNDVSVPTVQPAESGTAESGPAESGPAESGPAESGTAEVEARLRRALAIANIPTLLPLVVQLTGDMRWTEERYRPIRQRGIANSLGDNDDGGLPPEVQQEVREAAFTAISAWLADGRIAVPEPAEELLVQLLSISMMERIPAEYGAMFRSILGLEPENAPPRPAGRTRPPEGFRIVVVGAGASGLAMGHELLKAGIEFSILEKRDAVGGTWYRNHYPGCGVDSPSHLYSFSFYRYDWPHYFSLRGTLHDYFENLATDCGLRPYLRLRTELVDASYDEAAQRWALTVRCADGTVAVEYCDVLVSAVGAFATPSVPQLPGRDRFQGEVMHAADWRDDTMLDGRRVVVIGNGATAMQLVPAIVDRVAQLTVVQRTPQWIAPFEKFHVSVPDDLRWLFRTVPLYFTWYRLRLNWTFNDRVHPTLRRDPGWEHPERSMNRLNDRQRDFFRAYIDEQLGQRPDLVELLTPAYPPFGKRMLFDNGWYAALLRDHVSLNTSSAVALTSRGVRCGDGQEYDADVVIFATGFDAVSFLNSVQLHGRGGLSVRDAWDGDQARAYLGMTIPGFPNFFMLYGPNVQAGHGGSLLGKIELSIAYLRDVLDYMFASRLGAVEVTQEAYDRYDEAVQQTHAEMVWVHPGVRTYYRNSRGRVVVNSPYRNVDTFAQIYRPDFGDYRFEKRAGAPASDRTGAGDHRA